MFTVSVDVFQTMSPAVHQSVQPGLYVKQSIEAAAAQSTKLRRDNGGGTAIRRAAFMTVKTKRAGTDRQSNRQE